MEKTYFKISSCEFAKEILSVSFPNDNLMLFWNLEIQVLHLAFPDPF